MPSSEYLSSPFAFKFLRAKSIAIAKSRATMMIDSCLPTQMPVLVEVPVNHEAVKDMPEGLQSRINFKKSPEEVAIDSERMSARSEMLREAHLQSVRDRAARETQVPWQLP